MGSSCGYDLRYRRSCRDPAEDFLPLSAKVWDVAEQDDNRTENWVSSTLSSLTRQSKLDEQMEDLMKDFESKLNKIAEEFQQNLKDGCNAKVTMELEKSKARVEELERIVAESVAKEKKTSEELQKKTEEVKELTAKLQRQVLAVQDGPTPTPAVAVTVTHGAKEKTRTRPFECGICGRRYWTPEPKNLHEASCGVEDTSSPKGPQGKDKSKDKCSRSRPRR